MMKNYFCKTAFTFLLCLGSVWSYAKPVLSALFSDNMVLQQNTQAPIWGEATPGKQVKITPSWSKETISVTADETGKWKTSLPTPAAGGPYTITISDGKKIQLSNVMIGEVWICSGQSNMEMPIRGFDRQPHRGGNDIIARSKASTPIRIFNTDRKDGTWFRQSAKTPQEDMHGEWQVNSPENVAIASAAAYHFARYIQEVLEVPVGIMVSTLGGSMIEPWMSREALKAFPSVNLSMLDNGQPVKSLHTEPTVLFNAKVAPLTKFAIKGFLWYQGESNRSNYKLYKDLVPAFVKDLRNRWGRGDLPFYYVEIAPFDYEGANDISAARLREVQATHMKSIPNSGMVTTLDIGNHVFIHPMDKATVGQRLAWWALGKTYGLKGFGYAPPIYKSMEIKEHKVYINVENAGNGLCPMWTPLKGFEIAGEDRVFHPASAEIETKTCRLAVSSPEVPNPVAVRYGYHNYAEAYVFNIEGLPLVPFRTDNWDK